jgi:polysaccharide chain length determinant protein (PEP-CTERM system associated)
MAVQEVQEQGLNLGDVYAVLQRRKWWLVVPVVAAFVLSILLAIFLPREYEAASTVVAKSQEIPDELAPSTVTATAEELWENLRTEILARDSLSPIIDDFGLFADEQESVPREELIDLMRERVAIEPLPPAIVDPRKPVELTSFRIAFRWPVPDEAAAVANRLTREFISANLRERAKTAEGASEFITQELNRTQAEQQDIGQQITDYKENFQGELPEQLMMNREHLSRSQLLLVQNESSLEQAREQILQIRRDVQEMMRSSGNENEDPLVRRQALDIHLNHLISTGKTDKHPDVIRTRAEIAALGDVIANLGQNPPPASPELMRLRAELRNYEVQAQVQASEIERLKADIAEYEQRIENTPRRAAELAHLETTYENLNESIRSLQSKHLDAEMARKLEIANKGETFRIVESAVAPTTPTSPNIPLILVAGLAIGVMVGLGLLAVRELTDSSFYTVADLQKTLGLPVLATVPVIELPAERNRREQKIWRIGGSTAALLSLLVGGSLAARDPSDAPEGARDSRLESDVDAGRSDV